MFGDSATNFGGFVTVVRTIIVRVFVVISSRVTTVGRLGWDRCGCLLKSRRGLNFQFGLYQLLPRTQGGFRGFYAELLTLESCF